MVLFFRLNLMIIAVMKKGEPMSDSIYRHDAVKAIETSRFLIDAIEKLILLPSAQPEPEEFELCHDCKEYDQTEHCCHRWTKVIRQTVEELKALPERTGKWINAYPDKEPNPMFMYGTGSVCGYEQSISDGLKYCPNCGCRMLKEGEEHD